MQLQREKALARANEVRVGKARIKRELKAGKQSPLRLLADPPEYLQTASVGEFLRSCPNTGRETTIRLCVRANVKLDELTEAQVFRLQMVMRKKPNLRG